MAEDRNRPITLADLDRFATKEDLDRLTDRFATKEDLDRLADRFATKDDLKVFATKGDLEAFATRYDFANFATKDDLKIFATKDDLKGFATKGDFAALAVDVASLKAEFREFREEFSSFKTWTQNVLDGLVKDVSDLKQEMTVMRDSRMRRIHDRLTRVEKKVGLPPEEYY